MISSLDALPHDLKKQLKHISILAYKGVMNNKIVFTQDELPSILPRRSCNTILNFFSKILPVAATPAQQDLPVMGVLQKVQWAGTSSKTISYNFIHISIQEMLAAYCISQMVNAQQVRVFQTLLREPRFAAVLQFYAGFTKLTNRGVRNIIKGSDFTYSLLDKSSRLSLLSYIRCFFEAQIHDQSFYLKIIRRLNGKMNLFCVTLSPLDCMSIGYFLAFVLRNSRELTVDLSGCSIDDHSFCLMMGELSKHAEACPAGALHGVTELDISENKIGDNGIANIATALRINTTMKELNISWCNMLDYGAELLAKALATNRSLHTLYVNSYISDNGIAHIATALRTNNTLKTLTIGEETITDEGALSLAAALTANSSMEHLELYWSSTHPDSTLKNIGESVSKSTLRILNLEMIVRSSGEAPVAEEKAKEWLQCVEVGGKELIQSLEDSHLQKLDLIFYHTTLFNRFLSSTSSTRGNSSNRAQHGKKTERTPDRLLPRL